MWIEAATVSSLTGWRIVVGAPRALIDAPFWRSLAWLATAGLLATALAVAFCLYLSRKMVGAMATIQSATYRLALGRQVYAEPLPLLEASNVMNAVAQAGILVDARTRQLLQSEARYQAALRVGRMGSWETDFLARTRTWSQEAMDLFQMSLPSSKGIVGGPNDELRSAMHPDDRHLLERYHRLIQTLDEIEATYRIVLADGSVRHYGWSRQGHRPLHRRQPAHPGECGGRRDGPGAGRAAGCRALQGAGGGQGPLRGAGAGDRANRLVDNSRRRGCRGFADLARLHRPDLRGMEGYRLAAGRACQDRERTLLAWREAVASSSPYNIEYRLRHVSGGYRWTSARGVPLKNSEGEVTAWVGMNEDIADRKRRDEHLQLVMRELSHRTKNLLAVIQSIASRTFRDDVAGPVNVKTFIDRLHGIAVSHDLLVRGEWGGASLQELVTDHLAPFGAVPSKTVSIGGPHVLLKPAVAQSIGLALHELATNAAKYGALGDSGGRLDIAWEIATNGSGSLLSLRWREKSTGGTQPTQTAGFGRMLLERIVASSMNGRSTYEIGEEGVRGSSARRWRKWRAESTTHR